MKNWFIRVTILLAMAGILAIAQAAIRPLPPDVVDQLASQSSPPPQPAPEPEPAEIHKETSSEQPQEEPQQTAEPAGPDAEGNVYDLQWVVDQYNSGAVNIVDARPERFYREGHIPGAFHLDFGDFQGGPPEKMEMLRGLPAIIYCSGGDCDASHKVKMMLERYGFQDLYVFVPGMPAWEEAGLPVESAE